MNKDRYSFINYISKYVLSYIYDNDSCLAYYNDLVLLEINKDHNFDYKFFSNNYYKFEKELYEIGISLRNKEIHDCKFNDINEALLIDEDIFFSNLPSTLINNDLLLMIVKKLSDISFRVSKIESRINNI